MDTDTVTDTDTDRDTDTDTDTTTTLTAPDRPVVLNNAAYIGARAAPIGTFNATTKDLLRSPWRDEVERANNISSCTESGSNQVPAATANNVSTKFNESASRRINVSSPARTGSFGSPSAKRTKYHWSGTFNDHARKNSSFYEHRRRTFNISHEYLQKNHQNITNEETQDNDTEDNDTDYNYNLEILDEDKPKKTKLFCSWSNENNITATNGRRNVHEPVRRPRSNELNAIPQGKTLRRSSSRETERKRRESSSFISRSFRILLAVVKNLFLFSLLPTMYVGFFAYVRSARKTSEE